MSNWLTKSEFNFSSAEILHDKHHHYCSVVHCAYYSSVQLMLHILHVKINKTEQQARADAQKTKVSANDPDKGSHEIIISEVAGYLRNVNNKEFPMFNNNIGKLKQLRHKADYKNEAIIDKESKGSIETAREINKILRKAI